MRVRIVALAGLLLTVIPAAAQWQNAPQSQDTPRRGGTLTYGIGDPTFLDCHASNTQRSFQRILPHYSTLLMIDPNNYPNIVGDAAQSWQVSADSLTYAFKLHPAIVFHDGSPFTSADVKATYERLRNPPQGVNSVRSSQFVDIEDIATPDAQTVVFKLKQVNAAMLTIFASPFNCLYSAALLAKNPNYPEKTVMGTGPFKFVSYAPGAEWKGERFDKYFVPGRPYLDGFVVHTINPAGLVTALGGGRIMATLDGVTMEQRDNIMKYREGKSHSFEIARPAATLFVFNTRRKPFDDERVRRALSLAIDRWTGSKMLAAQMPLSSVGGFQRIGSPFGLSEEELVTKPGFSRDIEASRAEARRLLAEAGQSNLKFTYMNTPAYTPLGVFVIDQWRQVGVTVQQEIPDAATYFQRRTSGSFDVTNTGMPDIIDDPYLQLSMFPSASHNTGNLAFYDDPNVDELYQKQVSLMNFDDRRKAVRELEDYMFQKTYYAIGFWATANIVLANEIQGFTPSPAPGVGMQLRDIWLKQ
jgi:peptide/nickel transport system substrate-binding protein